MPHDLPNWSTVYDYYRRWVKTGLWEKLNAELGKVNFVFMLFKQRPAVYF